MKINVSSAISTSILVGVLLSPVWAGDHNCPRHYFYKSNLKTAPGVINAGGNREALILPYDGAIKVRREGGEEPKNEIAKLSWNPPLKIIKSNKVWKEYADNLVGEDGWQYQFVDINERHDLVELVYASEASELIFLNYRTGKEFRLRSDIPYWSPSGDQFIYMPQDQKQLQIWSIKGDDLINDFSKEFSDIDSVCPDKWLSEDHFVFKKEGSEHHCKKQASKWGCE